MPNVGTGNEPEVTGDYHFYLPVLLRGEFDTALDIEGEFDHPVAGTYYILEIYAPARCDVSLTARRKKLAAGSWAEQGQIFYSGTTVYRFDVSSYSGEAVLSAPRAAAAVEVRLDGRSCGRTGFQPFLFPLGDITAAGTLEIAVTNTMANEYEEFKAPSGLIDGAALLFKNGKGPAE
jgi:hypothetical protein